MDRVGSCDFILVAEEKKLRHKVPFNTTEPKKRSWLDGTAIYHDNPSINQIGYHSLNVLLLTSCSTTPLYWCNAVERNSMLITRAGNHPYTSTLNQRSLRSPIVNYVVSSPLRGIRCMESSHSRLPKPHTAWIVPGFFALVKSNIHRLQTTRFKPQHLNN